MTHASHDAARGAEAPHTGAGSDASSALASLPVPPLEPTVSARALRRARGELRMRGEGTLSVAGLLAAWDASMVPALVFLTGVAYGALAAIRVVEIFVGS